MDLDFNHFLAFQSVFFSIKARHRILLNFVDNFSMFSIAGIEHEISFMLPMGSSMLAGLMGTSSKNAGDKFPQINIVEFFLSDRVIQSYP